MSGSKGSRPRVVLYLHRLQVATPTGVHRYAIELSRALGGEEAEFDIELCSGRTTDAGPLPKMPLPLTHPRAPRKPLHLAWMLTGRPSPERLIGPMDLFHSLLPLGPVRTKAPQVATIHDLIAVHHPDWHPGLAGDGIRRAIRFQSETAAAIIVPSQATANDLQEMYGVGPDRIAITPEAPSGFFATPCPPERQRTVQEGYDVGTRPYVIAIGAVSERKNLEVLMLALAALRDRGVNPPDLVIAGPDDVGAAAVREAPRRHSVDDLVRFAGWVPPDDLLALLAGATALVHPSWYEGFGLTPLEAMTAGVPVIASTRGSVPEVVGDAGLLAAPDKPEEWADGLEILLSRPERRAELVDRGRHRAATYSWEKAARQTLAVYRKVLG
jgi:glycosyltransferase involved in cell wall biosynthesis